MENLFQTSQPYENFKRVLSEPLIADYAKSTDSNKYCHDQTCFSITNKKIRHVKQTVVIKDEIESLYFVHVDAGRMKWDDRYWFFVGKLKHGTYFTYESGCCGTGFGLGSESKLYLSKNPELLYDYALSNEQRNLINTTDRFTCPEQNHEYMLSISDFLIL